MSTGVLEREAAQLSDGEDPQFIAADLETQAGTEVGGEGDGGNDKIIIHTTNPGPDRDPFARARGRNLLFLQMVGAELDPLPPAPERYFPSTWRPLGDTALRGGLDIFPPYDQRHAS